MAWGEKDVRGGNHGLDRDCSLGISNPSIYSLHYPVVGKYASLNMGIWICERSCKELKSWELC